tara:strand:- start:40253 stop:40696 length:444 start_codon:yes stop_codon:yes gene_type:complete
MSEVKVDSNTAISMPVRNLISIVGAVAVGVWAYFGVQERLNRLETFEKLIQQTLKNSTAALTIDIEKNNEFRIKWPRGEMGTPPADGEQFMLLEHLGGQVEKVQTRLEEGMSNGVNIKRLQEDVKQLRVDVEKLKDTQRNLLNGGVK